MCNNGRYLFFARTQSIKLTIDFHVVVQVMGDSIFSKEAEVRAEHKVKLDREREQRGLALGDTKARVKKYDRLKKKNKIKVGWYGKG